MERIRVLGGAPLRGEVAVAGAKNSVLKLMAASLLAPGRTTLLDAPDIVDVRIMAELLRRLGCEVDHRPGEGGTVVVDVPERPGHRADYELVRAMRASISVLGPLVARVGAADVAMPGGDAIGSRGLDLHADGLRALGAEVHVDHGYLVAAAPQGLVGTRVDLAFPSVGATENLLAAAALARGETVIDNVAREPEVVDLAEMLVAMGARVDGIGTSRLVVTGVEELSPVTHRVVPDRVVAGSWAFAAALTGGDVHIRGARADHLATVLDKLRLVGAEVSATDGGVRVVGPSRCRAADVATLPFPGFPTDLQPFALTLLSVAQGSAVVTENLFESRFRFAHELVRLGADLRIDGQHVLVRGRARLSGAPVEANDIRAGAALVVAGLVADGVTEVVGVEHIDRGYAGFVGSLRRLGADVERYPVPDVAAAY